MQPFKIMLKVLLVAIIAGCQKDLGVELPYEGKRLVVFGLISADSIVSVKVDGTGPPTGVFLYADSVADASVELFEDGVFLETLKYTGKGIYRSPNNFKPVTGKGYSIKVTAPGFPPAETSSEIIPSRVQLEEYILGDTIPSIFTGETARRVTFTFIDDAQESDFYNAIIIGQYKGNYTYLNTFVADRPYEASEDICGFPSEGSQYVLQDVCFNGQPFTFSLGVAMVGSVQEVKGIDKRPGEQVECDQIFLRLRKITKTYRDYLRVAGIENEGFLSAFTIPIREYTNIKGGYGVWAAYSEDVVDVLQ
jgi:hypothetical protein